MPEVILVGSDSDTEFVAWLRRFEIAETRCVRDLE
jgi:hypothetical protein